MRYKGFIVGHMKNSYYKDSSFIGYSFESETNDKLSLTLMIANNYKKYHHEVIKTEDALVLKEYEDSLVFLDNYKLLAFVSYKLTDRLEIHSNLLVTTATIKIF